MRGVDLFLDGPKARARDAVHLVFAGEKVRPEYALPSPELSESKPMGLMRVVSLEGLVRMKLTSYRLKYRVHLLDMLEVGLIDSSWVKKLPLALGERLQELIANPEGIP